MEGVEAAQRRHLLPPSPDMGNMKQYSIAIEGVEGGGFTQGGEDTVLRAALRAGARGLAGLAALAAGARRVAAQAAMASGEIVKIDMNKVPAQFK